MRRNEREGVMNKIFCVLIAMMSTVSIALASDSSVVIPITSVKVVQRQPVLIANKAIAVTVHSNQANKISCPDGYAMKTVTYTTRQKVGVIVNGDCKYATLFGLVPVWCDKTLKTNQPNSSSPVTTYVCQKLDKQWSDVVIAGTRG